MTTFRTAGFTLLEMLVAVSLFSVFMLIMVSIFTRFIATERLQITQQAMQQDVFYALETFNREVRTAYGDTFSTIDGSQLFLHNQAGSCVQYIFIDGALKRGEAAAGDCRTASYSLVPLTSKDINILKDSSRFDPVPTIKNTSQGFVTLVMSVTSRRATVPILQLQSTITSEQLTLYPG